MTHQPAYDPFETITWMLEKARAELTADTVTLDDGRTKKKSRFERCERSGGFLRPKVSWL